MEPMPAGRPKKAPEDRADAQYRIRLTASQKDAWEAAAKAKGISLAEWIKSLGDAAAKKSAKRG